MAHRPQLAARRRLASNAQRARIGRGWTQEFAAEIGCSVQQLRRVERAATNASTDFAARLAAVYKVDIQELFAPVGPWKNPQRGRPRSSVKRPESGA